MSKHSGGMPEWCRTRRINKHSDSVSEWRRTNKQNPASKPKTNKQASKQQLTFPRLQSYSGQLWMNYHLDEKIILYIFRKIELPIFFYFPNLRQIYFLLSSHIEDEISHTPKDTATESALGHDLSTRVTWVLAGGCPLALSIPVCFLSHLVGSAV